MLVVAAANHKGRSGHGLHRLNGGIRIRPLGIVVIDNAESMEEAVEICAEKAEPGDAVLLSPACASWGMFQNYEERGRIFKDCVKRL